MCNKHYTRWLRYGDPTTAKRPKGLSPHERFERFVIRQSGCWDWSGATNNHGYARIHDTYAHRISWEIHFGPIPSEYEVCHSCDNPPCTRPDHLFLATHKENMLDMSRKGRGRKCSEAAA
jgi:hypothetical protein